MDLKWKSPLAFIADWGLYMSALYYVESIESIQISRALMHQNFNPLHSLDN